MAFSLTLARKFDNVLEHDEIVVWTGRPAFLASLYYIWPFLLIPPLFLGLLYLGVFQFLWTWMPSRIYFLFAVALMKVSTLLLLLAMWTTVYAITNKRIWARFWFLGYRHQRVDYKEIADIAVVTSPIDKWLGVGTIRLDLGFLQLKKLRIYKRIVGIPEAGQASDLMTRLARVNPLLFTSAKSGH